MVWCSASILALLCILELQVSSSCSKTGHFSSLWILRSREGSLTNHEGLKMNNANFRKVLEKSWNLKTELQWESFLRLIGVSEVILVFSQTHSDVSSLSHLHASLWHPLFYFVFVFPPSLSSSVTLWFFFFFLSHFVPFTLILRLPPAVPGREQRFVDNMLLETDQERWQCVPCDFMCVYVCVYTCVCVHAKWWEPLRALCLPVSLCYWCHVSLGTHTTSSQLPVRRLCERNKAHAALHHLTVLFAWFKKKSCTASKSNQVAVRGLCTKFKLL